MPCPYSLIWSVPQTSSCVQREPKCQRPACHRPRGVMTKKTTPRGRSAGPNFPHTLLGFPEYRGSHRAWRTTGHLRRFWRGSMGEASGLTSVFWARDFGQCILPRTAVKIREEAIISCGLPASGRRILGRQARGPCSTETSIPKQSFPMWSVGRTPRPYGPSFTSVIWWLLWPKERSCPVSRGCPTIL
jgi:hypothetical protein